MSAVGIDCHAAPGMAISTSLCYFMRLFGEVMANLILHVGPAKCGSTTIQQFFLNQKDPCRQKLHFLLLNPVQISELNAPEVSEHTLAGWSKLLEDSRKGAATVIASHEYLFQCPLAVQRICGLGRDRFSQVAIIGYCRRQGDFLVSAYSQWLFRAPRRIQEVIDVLREHDFVPDYFSGLERQLIASIMNDFHSARQLSEYSILNWYRAYRTISDQVETLGAAVHCATMPGRNDSVSLVENFCRRAGLDLRWEMAEAGQRIANVSYHPDIIEAINCAVTRRGKVPGPHESNERLEELSLLLESDPRSNSAFIDRLKGYVDAFFLEENLQLCNRYALDPGYFRAPDVCSKMEIIEAIRLEQESRKGNPAELLERYRQIAGKMIELSFR